MALLHSQMQRHMINASLLVAYGFSRFCHDVAQPPYTETEQTLLRVYELCTLAFPVCVP